MGRQNFVETDDNRIEVTTNYLCKILGVSDTTIAVWVRNGCPKLRKGWFDVGAVVRLKYAIRKPRLPYQSRSWL